MLVLLFCCYHADKPLCNRWLWVVTIKLLVATKPLFAQFDQIFCAFFGPSALNIGNI